MSGQLPVAVGRGRRDVSVSKSRRTPAVDASRHLVCGLETALRSDELTLKASAARKSNPEHSEVDCGLTVLWDIHNARTRLACRESGHLMSYLA